MKSDSGNSRTRRLGAIRGCRADMARAWRRLAYLAFILCGCGPQIALSQTPSALQEWQYSSGIVLQKLFEPDLPEWRVVAGVGAELKPLYDGSKPYRVQGGPVFNVLYRDIAFASVGEGLGVNFLHGDHYRAGIALGYDLGRRESDDLTHLRGLGDIGRAPVIKLFGSYVISKEFPLVLRADVRQIAGGAHGLLGDLEAYMPLPGSSKRLVMFAGPSITFADHRYSQNLFGITTTQALASGYSDYAAHAGADAAGLGFSATGFITKHWLVNADLAVNHLLGSASDSPITQSRTQGVFALSVEYKWN
jgi:outer membrane scaffolding protein for murein synthesis (MipA/OmpV family)